MEAHIVMFTTGEFEMAFSTPIRVFLDKKEAENWIETQNRKLVEEHLHEDGGVLEKEFRDQFRFTENGIEEISNKGYMIDYTGASVYLSSVPCS
jgi:hypothetical protein